MLIGLGIVVLIVGLLFSFSLRSYIKHSKLIYLTPDAYTERVRQLEADKVNEIGTAFSQAAIDSITEKYDDQLAVLRVRRMR